MLDLGLLLLLNLSLAVTSLRNGPEVNREIWEWDDSRGDRVIAMRPKGF